AFAFSTPHFALAQTPEPEIVDLAQGPAQPVPRPQQGPAGAQPQRPPVAQAPALPPLRAFQRDDMNELARKFEASIANKTT
ncbi:hypothetical protein ABTD83_21355, partial [Acinetobacter baumannii]